MTVKDFWTDFVERNRYDLENGKPRAKLSDLTRGSLIGVDISIWLYRALGTISSARQFDAVPKVPVTSALQWVKAKHQVLVTNGLVPVYVFDGVHHNMKDATNTAREENRQQDLAKLNEMKSNPRIQDRKSVDDLRKKITFPREDVIALVVEWFRQEKICFFSAPFEAEWQLVYFEKNNMISSIISEDGDCFILGAQTVVTSIDWNTSRCSILKRDAILQRECAGEGRFNDYLPEFSALLGNDYINRLHGNSYKKVKDIMEKYISCSDKDSFLKEIELKSKWPKSFDGNFKSPAAGFFTSFKNVTSLIRKAPIFEVTFLHNKTCLTKLHDNLTLFEVHLTSLSNLSINTNSSWPAEIGFSHHPQAYLEQAPKAVYPRSYKDAFLLNLWLRTGQPLRGIEQPILHCPPYYTVAHGSYLDFSSCPAVLQPLESLWQFLFVRNLAPKGDPSLEQLLQLVENVEKLEGQHGNLAPKPKQLSEIKNSKGYQILEALTTEGIKVNWITDSTKVFHLVRGLKKLDNEEIFRIFGAFNGIRHRALRRLDGGHYNLDTLQCCRAVLKEGSVPCIMFKIQVTPSLKANCYWSILVFEAASNGCFIPAPASRCECPTGQHFCSHMLGAIILLYLIQANSSWDKDDLICALPPPIKSIQSCPIPWGFVFGKNSEESLIHRNAKVFVYPEGSDGQLDYDDDCDNKEVTFSDEAAVFLSDASNLLDEDTNENADLKESCEVKSDEKLRVLNLCAEADKIVRKSRERSIAMESEKSHAHKITLEHIGQANQEKLDDIGGPNESFESKLEQLELHERLHKLYSSGKLGKNNLSHYLNSMKETRDRQLQQLRFGVGVKFSGFVKNAVRLAKIPPGYTNLADRGFASCAMYYPNLNAQVTPHFLAGREQFHQEEISADRLKCQVRYTSETYFSRVTDTTALRDRISFSLFQHLSHIVDWAHGRANFCQPLQQPSHDDYFAQGDQLQKK